MGNKTSGWNPLIGILVLGVLLIAGSVLTVRAESPSYYDLELTPDSALQYGDNGEMVVYDFTVQNTGTDPDGYLLSLAGYNWPTYISTNYLGPLDPNMTANFQITVTVPVTAVAYTFDFTAVTAQSEADLGIMDTSPFTTEVIAHYNMLLSPPSDSQIGNPGEIVTYTLTLENTGNVTDTYDLAISPTAWPTSLSTGTIGPLAPWSGESFYVNVTIPPGANHGEQDTVTVTVDSQSAPALSEVSVLITEAESPSSYGVELTPDSTLKYGDNGDMIVYDFTVQNTGTNVDSYDLVVSDAIWPTSMGIGNINSLAPGATASFQISVTVPVTAVAYAYDKTNIAARSAAEPSIFDTSVFTSEVMAHYSMILDPSSSSQLGNPGMTMTYTLILENSGNVADTYDLVISSTTWPTSLSVNTIGPLNPWSGASFYVYVTIPASAMEGAQDVVTVTASSQGAPSLSAASVLTTVATTQPITRRFYLPVVMR